MLPEGQQGKGRGTRAFARKLTEDYIVHDASYWCSIQLLGRIEMLVETLSCICGDVDTVIREILSGRIAPMFLREFNFVAHRPRKVPSEAYGPVTCMFSPCVSIEGTQSEENARLILWVHCGYASELVADLRTCLRQELLRGLEWEIGSLGRIELRGPKTASAISKVFETKLDSKTLISRLLDKNCVHSQSGKKGYGAVLTLSGQGEQLSADTQIECLGKYTKPVKVLLEKILESLVDEPRCEKSSSTRVSDMAVYLIVHCSGTVYYPSN